MAFQVPSVHLTAVATDVWPSLKSAFRSPWKTYRQARERRPNANALELPEITERPRRSGKALSIDHHQLELPECLAQVPIQSLRPLHLPLVRSRTKFPSVGLLSSTMLLRTANPYHLPSSTPHSFRSYSTFSTLKAIRSRSAIRARIPPSLQRRDLVGVGSSSQNLLAHMEQTANNNPTSASAQNAFYSALLRADMPNIVVERFQTGRYASSEACENTYQKALEKTVRAESNGAIPGIQRGNMSGTLSEEQSRNIGVSTVAQMYGAAGAKVLPGSTGQKQSPIHVVIEESRGASVFRWVKFFVTYAIYGYLVFVLVSLVLEMSGMLRRPGAIPNADAQLQQQKVRFSDVHGCEEAKDELQELVEFLKNPERFTKLGGKLPKGVLLVGPPGTGKTMLARAVAGEAGVPFYYMSGSEFDEIYVGVGAKRVRELFATARAKAPAIVFIDELDAIGAKRNERDPVYVKQSLNQLLTELDGFSQETGVIILGATNFPQLLDKALTRPGRFDRKVQVSLPDVRGRLQILKHYLKKIKAENNLDESVIARGTSGFSGAELESLVNQAAVHASRNGAPAVSMPDLDWAKDKIMMGAERRSAIIKDEHKLLTAYHEAGHALVGLYTKGTDPVYKITIMPRGQALGVTYFMPEMDKDYGNYSRAELLAKLDVAMGGKAAEQIVYGEDNVTMGCGMDISNATTIAHQMVTQGGMSTTLGNMDLANWKALSPDTAAAIEKEVRSMLEDARDRAAKILDEKRNELDLLAKALIECESLDLDEMMKAIKGEKIEKMKIMKGVGIKLPEIVLPPGIGTGQTAGGAGSEASRQGSNERTGDGEGSEAEIPRKVNVA